MDKLEALDNANPRLPGGYTTCRQCNRLVKAEHVDGGGLCAVCAGTVQPAPPVSFQPAASHPVAGEPGSSTTKLDGSTRGVDDLPGGTPDPAVNNG